MKETWWKKNWKWSDEGIERLTKERKKKLKNAIRSLRAARKEKKEKENERNKEKKRWKRKKSTKVGIHSPLHSNIRTKIYNVERKKRTQVIYFVFLCVCMFNPLTADNFCRSFLRREGKVFFPYPPSTLSLTVSIQNACLFLPNSFHSIFILKCSD